MKKLLLSFLFSCNLIFAQIHNKSYMIDYELKYAVDTLSSHNFTENFVLRFSNNESFFCSEKIVDASIDSGVSLSEGIIDMNRVVKNKTLFVERIILNKKNDLESYLTFNSSFFYYKQEKPIWQILPDKKTINGIICQKAQTNFIGRDWIAWFSVDYPVSYGPYKFVGLPGLILEVYDINNTYLFTTISIKESPYNIKSLYNGMEQAKNVSKKEYFNVLDNILYDTNTLTKFSSLFDKFPPEKVQQYRKMLDDKRKKRNNFPIDRDIN